MLDIQRYIMPGAENILIVEVSGKLDNEASQFLVDYVDGEIEDGHHALVLDCRNLDYISSLGLGTLVRLHSRMKKRGGTVKLARLTGFVAEILTAVRLNSLFQFYPTVHEACGSF